METPFYETVQPVLGEAEYLPDDWTNFWGDVIINNERHALIDDGSGRLVYSDDPSIVFAQDNHRILNVITEEQELPPLEHFELGDLFETNPVLS